MPVIKSSGWRSVAELEIPREELGKEVRQIGIRELIRFGCGRRILEKIARGEPLNVRTIAEYERRISEYNLSKRRTIRDEPG